jgi:hypothetical protein
LVSKHAKTIMLAMIDPRQGNTEHTLNTLRYAERVRVMKAPGANASTQNTSDKQRDNSPVTSPLLAHTTPPANMPSNNSCHALRSSINALFDQFKKPLLLCDDEEMLGLLKDELGGLYKAFVAN